MDNKDFLCCFCHVIYDCTELTAWLPLDNFSKINFPESRVNINYKVFTWWSQLNIFGLMDIVLWESRSDYLPRFFFWPLIRVENSLKDNYKTYNKGKRTLKWSDKKWPTVQIWKKLWQSIQMKHKKIKFERIFKNYFFLFYITNHINEIKFHILLRKHRRQKKRNEWDLFGSNIKRNLTILRIGLNAIHLSYYYLKVLDELQISE